MYVDANKDSIERILLEFRESAYGPPAPWLGAPLQAAAGRATTVKLQILIKNTSLGPEKLGDFHELDGYLMGQNRLASNDAQ